MGIEARGFVLGGAIAHELGRRLRRGPQDAASCPSQRVGREYALEYGTDVLEMHADAVAPGQRVLVHDDLLATGGTALRGVPAGRGARRAWWRAWPSSPS